MKKSVKVLIALVALIFIFSFTPTKNQHVGTWKGVDEGVTAYFIFDSAGFATFQFDGKNIGGRSFVMEGTTAQMTYVIDYTTKPISIDLIVSAVKTGEEIQRAKGIVEFVSAEKMKVNIDFLSKGRPTSFTGEDAFVLTKEK